MLAIDHVQLAIPAGGEEVCRRFYIEVLGMSEIPKPAILAARGGLWVQSGAVQIHLGVEADFRPARKAHPAIVVANLDALATRVSDAGHAPTWDGSIPGLRRFFVSDPHGNRIEFMEPPHG
ncbi:glyoxalase [Salinarimonas soli]|uniref:Glyoxalase n=2 Tax=Salinarimonas soli TaxID=1638099 RepID=A0A5B2V9Z9_9HYPH|nr:glyoxalase [Salinarimonas soli]